MAKWNCIFHHICVLHTVDRFNHREHSINVGFIQGLDSGWKVVINCPHNSWKNQRYSIWMKTFFKLSGSAVWNAGIFWCPFLQICSIYQIPIVMYMPFIMGTIPNLTEQQQQKQTNKQTNNNCMNKTKKKSKINPIKDRKNSNSNK